MIVCLKFRDPLKGKMDIGRKLATSATVPYNLLCTHQRVILSKHRSDHITAFHKIFQQSPFKINPYFLLWLHKSYVLILPLTFWLLSTATQAFFAQHTKLILALGTSYSFCLDSLCTAGSFLLFKSCEGSLTAKAAPYFLLHLVLYTNKYINK